MHRGQSVQREWIMNTSQMKWELGEDFWWMLLDSEMLHQKGEQRRIES